MKRQQDVQEQAKAALQLAAERMKWYYDKGVQNIPFQVRDKVLLNLKDYQHTERALQLRYERPFEIVEKLSPVMFKLKLPSNFCTIHLVFRASKLATYNELTIKGQQVNSPEPTLIKSDEEWKVEQILQERTISKKKQYLIRWKGFRREHNTWEPEDNLENAKEILQKWKKSHKKKSVHIVKLLDNEDHVDLLKRDSTLQVELIDGKLPM